MIKTFDGKKNAKLGTEANPAVISVQTQKRMQEVESIFKENNWKYKIDLDADKPEDTTDMEILLNPQQTVTVEKKPGRNDPCPCGSGKKFKKCCDK